MAKLTTNPAVLVKPVLPAVARAATFNLELTAEELATLYCVYQLIGGCPENSLRGHTESVTDHIIKNIPELNRAFWTVRDDNNDSYGVRVLTSQNDSIGFKSGSHKNKTFTNLVETLKRKQ